MRFTTTLLAVLTSFAAACFGEVGGPRRQGAGSSDPRSSDGACTKVEHDVTVRTAADMAALPRTGCYEILGKLTLQGSSITSLVGLGELSSVDELDLDHTSVTTFDTRRSVGIYGKLTVTGNAKLKNLAQLAFKSAPTGILIDGNAALTTLDPLGLDSPPLEEVGGDLVITGNPALTVIPLPHLTKVTGALTVSGNAAVKALDLRKLATTGHVEIADNPQLASISGLAATSIGGDLAIRNNKVLTTLGAMTALYRVTGSLTIDGNPALTNLAAFTTSLKFVDQVLTIANNQNLAELGALKQLQLAGAIAITNNPSLVVCRAIEIDRCVAHPTAAVITNNKDVDCDWQCN